MVKSVVEAGSQIPAPKGIEFDCGLIKALKQLVALISAAVQSIFSKLRFEDAEADSLDGRAEPISDPIKIGKMITQGKNVQKQDKKLDRKLEVFKNFLRKNPEMLIMSQQYNREFGKLADYQQRQIASCEKQILRSHPFKVVSTIKNKDVLALL